MVIEKDSVGRINAEALLKAGKRLLENVSDAWIVEGTRLNLIEFTCEKVDYDFKIPVELEKLREIVQSRP